MREIKFRAWYESEREQAMLYVGDDHGTTHPLDCCTYLMQGQPVSLMQYIGLKDKNGVEIYFDDVCEFDNGDRFIVRQEDWLECWGEWIGEPECEDQLRDFYRAGKSRVIGNIYENPELLTKQDQ